MGVRSVPHTRGSGTSRVAFAPAVNTSRRTIALGLGFWTLVALAFTTSTWAGYAVKGAPISWRTAGIWSFTEWFLWGALAPFVFALTRRHPMTRAGWRRSLPWHLLGWLAVTAVWSAGYVTVERALTPYDGMPATWPAHFVLYLSKKPAFSLLVYAVMVGAAHGIDLYRAYRERERRTAQLETQLARSQLDALRSQLQPHFLFNTLHTITAMVRRDPPGAERIVARLSDLLRLSLQTAQESEVTLRRELEFLDAYLDIQRTRFADRLRVDLEIPSETLEGLVPTLLLQPIVENAVKHGIEPHAAAGRISVRSWREGGRLMMEVLDDGPGFNGVRDGGIGLANTRERLRALYGGDHLLTLGKGPAGGARVLIALPWRTAPGPA